jgi:hypothetical protein
MPTLGTSKEDLIAEYKKLDALLTTVNLNIKIENEKAVAAQQQVEGYRNQGLQVVGQANVIGRMLNGMGIDARTLKAETGPNEPNLAPFSVPELENEAEVPEPKEFTPVSGIRNRFAGR